MGRKTRFKPFDGYVENSKKTDSNRKEINVVVVSVNQSGTDGNAGASQQSGSFNDPFHRNNPRNYGNDTERSHNVKQHRNSEEQEYNPSNSSNYNRTDVEKREGSGEMADNDDARNESSEKKPKVSWGPKSNRYRERNYRVRSEVVEQKQETSSQENPNNDWSNTTVENKPDEMGDVTEDWSKTSEPVKNETFEETNDGYQKNHKNYTEKNQEYQPYQGHKSFRNSNYGKNRNSEGYQHRDRDNDRNSYYNRNPNSEGQRDRDNDRPPYNRNPNSQGQRDRNNDRPPYNRNPNSQGQRDRDNDRTPYNRNPNSQGQRDRDNDRTPYNRNSNSQGHASRDDDRTPYNRNSNSQGHKNRDDDRTYNRNSNFEGNKNRDSGRNSHYNRNRDYEGQHRDRDNDRSNTQNWRDNSTAYSKDNNRNRDQRPGNSTGGRGGRGQGFVYQREAIVGRDPRDNFGGSKYDANDTRIQQNTAPIDNWNVEIPNKVPLPDQNYSSEAWDEDDLSLTELSPSGITSPGSSNLNPCALSFHIPSSLDKASWADMSADDEMKKENSSQFHSDETNDEISIEMETQCAISRDQDEGIITVGSKVLNKSELTDSNDKSKKRSINYRQPTLGEIDNRFSWDKEFEEYRKYRASKEIKYTRVLEVEKDLFSVEPEYALAHCVAEDMKMGSGIAVQFCQTFKCKGELLEQRKKQGDVAVLQVPIENSKETRYIYYMVTKKISEGKPTYETLWSSMKKMREHIKQDDVKKLAIPRIGCGLDRLEWDWVKPMLEFAFRDVDLEILVCNYQQEEFASPSSRKSFNKSCKIVPNPKSITEIESYTLIVYFATKDGHPTPAMLELDKKFSYLLDFKKAKKNLGETVRFNYKTDEYLLYGCVVADKMGDPFGFANFEKCLHAIQKENRKARYEFVAFQRVEDEDTLNDKILGLMKSTLRNVEIHCCAAPKKD